MSIPTSEPADVMGAIFRRRAEKADTQALAQRNQSLDEARALIRNNDRDPNAYIAAARTCKQSGRLYEALDILHTGLDRCASTPSLHEYYIERLEKCNRTEEAIASASSAARLFPDELIFRLREALLLPVFYNTREQIEFYRARFIEGLHRIVREVPLDSTRESQRAFAAIGKSSNKYLPYQGQNDRDLQRSYGGWVNRIMSSCFPELAQPVPMPPVEGKIRVGYLTSQSARFVGTSAEKLFAGWIREHDRKQFEIFAYHADHSADITQENVRRWNISFRQIAGEVDAITRVIRADRLHVLVYLDFGIHPRMAQLAALRLAPIQCVAWDTPLTSGAPAMDYFLSSELMEPNNAQDHYSEALVKLPGVGVCFSKPVIPSVLLTKTRAEFGLREDAVVYLSCQSVFKYLPDQDQLIAQIARRVSNSQFVFLATNEIVEQDFKSRIARAFAAEGLQAADHCIWMREMNVLDFWNLHRLGDAFLDTVSWSGGVTTLEAVACGLPVVTLPGELMRARHSYAILTQLGVTETIAKDSEEYVDIAVRLGLDREWRQDVINRMIDGYPRLYSDTRSVRALEDFYRFVAKEGLT